MECLRVCTWPDRRTIRPCRYLGISRSIDKRIPGLSVRRLVGLHGTLSADAKRTAVLMLALTRLHTYVHNSSSPLLTRSQPIHTHIHTHTCHSCVLREVQIGKHMYIIYIALVHIGGNKQGAGIGGGRRGGLDVFLGPWHGHWHTRAVFSTSRHAPHPSTHLPRKTDR